MKKSTKMIFGAAACAGLFAAAQVPGKKRSETEKFDGWRYAHRGLHDIGVGIPENTLPAFKEAFENGFGAELDVHMTLDRQLVVIHDSTLTRLCGDNRAVEEMLYKDLKELKIKGTEYGVPLFSEVLELCAGRSPLIVEIKTYRGNFRELCMLTAEMLDRYTGDYCIESFDPRAVAWFRDRRPGVVRGQLSENFMKRGEGMRLNAAERFAMTHLLTNFLTKPDFIAYKYSDRGHPAVKTVCGLFGAKEVNWTIDRQIDMDAAEGRGAIAIFERFLPAAYLKNGKNDEE